MVEFTHIRDDRVQMVDIGGKKEVLREAVATGRINLRPETIRAIREGEVTKGNVLATARIAATLAVKGTPGIIPLCHTIPISSVTVDLDVGETFILAAVRVTSEGKTGVEMEALTGTAVALLTIWDMVKSAEKDESGQYPCTSIESIRVVEKRKGT
jgi:cyclic pyranopterin phosphate synthase